MVHDRRGLLLLIAFILYRNIKKEKNLSALLAEKNEKLVDSNAQLLNDIEEARKNENLFEVLQNSFLELDNKSKTKIKLSNIVFLESKDKKVFIHMTDGGTFEDWQALKSFAAILPKELFMQIHRAFIVNIYHVTVKPNGSLSMSNGEVLKVTRNYKEDVEASLSKFKINGQ